MVAAANGGGIYTWRTTAPLIASEPQSQTIPGAISVEFSVGAFTIAAAQYQWMFDGIPLQNATNSTLTLTNVTALEAGSSALNVEGLIFFEIFWKCEKLVRES